MFYRNLSIYPSNSKKKIPKRLRFTHNWKSKCNPKKILSPTKIRPPLSLFPSLSEHSKYLNVDRPTTDINCLLMVRRCSRVAQYFQRLFQTFNWRNQPSTQKNDDLFARWAQNWLAIEKRGRYRPRQRLINCRLSPE